MQHKHEILTKKTKNTVHALMAKLVRHLTSNEEIVGSNPAESSYFF